MPPRTAFFVPTGFYQVLLHETAHWSGAEHRLNRDLSGAFGSASYAREELVAEMAGAFLCAALSIVPAVRHADYLANWLEVLREDNRAIIRAASAASKAADYVLPFQDRDLGTADPLAPAPGSKPAPDAIRGPGQAMFLQPDVSPLAAAQP
jgi:antirestriction protein ArdC